MPKIRGIKPETWTDDKFVQLSPLARLLYMGMWNYACDNGHLEDNVVQLKIRLLPVDNCDVSKLLKEIEDAERITRKNGCIKVLRLAEHQTPDKRFITVCEWCFDDPDTTYDPVTKRPRSESSRSAPQVDPPSTPSTHTDDGDCDVDVDSDVEGEKRRSKRARPLPEDFAPNDHHRSIAASRGIDLNLEVDKLRDWAKSNGATKKDWDATFNNWLRGVRNYSGSPANAQGPAPSDAPAIAGSDGKCPKCGRDDAISDGLCMHVACTPVVGGVTYGGNAPR